jgi:hypothetical protein
MADVGCAIVLCDRGDRAPSANLLARQIGASDVRRWPRRERQERQGGCAWRGWWCATSGAVRPRQDDTVGVCRPSFQAQVWSARDRKTIRKTFPTVAEALAWRQEAKASLRAGLMRAPSPTTLAEAAQEWLERAAAGVIRTRSGDLLQAGSHPRLPARPWLPHPPPLRPQTPR